MITVREMGGLKAELADVYAWFEEVSDPSVDFNPPRWIVKEIHYRQQHVAYWTGITEGVQGPILSKWSASKQAGDELTDVCKNGFLEQIPMDFGLVEWIFFVFRAF